MPLTGPTWDAYFLYLLHEKLMQIQEVLEILCHPLAAKWELWPLWILNGSCLFSRWIAALTGNLVEHEEGELRRRVLLGSLLS